MTVTIMDIARASGKSYPTVSRAMNDHPRISEKTKREIRAVAARLGYRPSFAGTALKKGRTSTFSIIVPDLADPYYAKFISCFKQTAQEKEFDVVVYDYERRSDLERKYLERMMSGCCDGAVAFITSFLHTRDLVEGLWNARIPLTAIGTPHEFAGNAKYDWGSIDADSSILKILRHLKRQGKRCLVYLQEPQPKEISMLLSKHLEELLNKAGLPFSSGSFFTLHSKGQNQAEEGFNAGVKLLKDMPEVDMIWARNGFQAYGLLLAAHQCGRKVPEDLAVIINDNTWISRYSVTPLYCLDQQLDELAGWTFRCLHDRSTAREWGEPRRFLITAKAVIPAMSAPAETAAAVP